MITTWQGLWIGTVILLLMGLLSAWHNADEDCKHGVVVRNMVGWPVCVEASQ